MNEAETVTLLCELLYTREPFVHVRFGDGDVFFATGTGPKMTADGEHWSPELQQRLVSAFTDLVCPDHLLLGDLRTYAVSDGCEDQWDGLLEKLETIREGQDKGITFVHMEALRVGFGHALPFYQALRDDTRSKMFIGPERLWPVAEKLGCDWHLIAPLHVAHEHANEICAEALDLSPAIAIFAAGRGGKIMQGALACDMPHLTQIDVGSGVDLLIDDGVRRGTDLGVNRNKILRQYRQAGLCP